MSLRLQQSAVLVAAEMAAAQQRCTATATRRHAEQVSFAVDQQKHEHHRAPVKGVSSLHDNRIGAAVRTTQLLLSSAIEQ